MRKKILDAFCKMFYNKHSNPYSVLSSLFLRDSMKEYILRNIVERNQYKYVVKDGKYF